MTDNKHPLYYDSIEDYTADVIASREAYAADERVRAGFCATGCGRRKNKHAQARKCWQCQREGKA